MAVTDGDDDDVVPLGRNKPPPLAKVTTGREESVEISPPFSDDGLARRFTHEYGDDLKYVAKWSRWFSWNGCQWQEDDTLATYDKARGVCRAAAKECNKPKEAAGVVSATSIAAVERLAKADRKHAATVGEWDANDWLLNTPDGTVELRSGQLRPHDRTDLITRITPVGPVTGACPTWITFLRRVTGDDDDLTGFLKRMVGYSLTGSTREHALFFLYGTGANGKSVFMNTIAGVLGDYHRTAPMEVFTASKNDRHPTELAMLRGARLVTAVETEEGRRWAEARIKSLTGGDRISARFMRQDFFEFVPQFKLAVAGNHKPSLRNVDEAIRRRFNLIPFSQTIPVEERDDTLTDKLKGEWPGILAWAIEGAVEWHSHGLKTPAIITIATDEYLSEEDTLIKMALVETLAGVGEFAP